MKTSISVAIAGLAWFSTYVSAQPTKDLYELQERCVKRAAEVFERESTARYTALAPDRFAKFWKD